MNKKKIGALLVGATLLVGAMGSFAYFTGISNGINGGDGNALQALSITNGKIIVQGQVATNGTGATDWSYDVAKLSTDTDNDLTNGIQYTIAGSEDVITKEIDVFENMHRSPDISVVDEENQKIAVTGDLYSLPRAIIGAKLPTTITNARPGDAIVLGYNNGAKVEEGIKVKNDSNLTVKIQLVIKNDKDSKDKLDAIKAAGWKMYVGGQEVDFTGPEGSYDKNGIIIDLGVVGPDGTTSSMNVKGEGNNLADVRFELPLITDNNYQGNKGAAGSVQGIDLSELIEIQATQENNTGWNEDGSGNRITPQKQTQPEIQE